MKIASKNNTHPFKGINPQQKLIDLGIHPFQNKEKQKERSIKNNTQVKWPCDKCDKTGKGKGNFTMHKRKCYKDANL